MMMIGGTAVQLGVLVVPRESRVVMKNRRSSRVLGVLECQL